MRGEDKKQSSMLMLMSPETLHKLSPVFDRMYARGGRPSIPPERLLKSMCKRIEEVFGWLKTVGNFRKTRYVGLGTNQVAAHMLASAYNLLRIAKLHEAV